MQLIIFLYLLYTSNAWNTDDLALYDLVEEVNENFYEFFGLEKEATTQEVKKAYRRLSLEWHPDRSDKENTVEKFRQIVSIYEVLKNPEMRDRYDQILENGLPDWRSGVYYYRRARKVSLFEAFVLLITIFTGVHYLMLWGTYYEKYLVESQNNKKLKSKKDKKGQRAAGEEENKRMDEVLQEYRPSWSKMLPCVMWRASTACMLFAFGAAKEAIAKKQSEEIEPDLQVRKRPTAVPQPVYEFAMATGIKAVLNQDDDLKKKYESEEQDRVAKYAKDIPWSCEELALLVKLSTEKYPVGTPNRWESMAQVLQRPPDDVTAMAGKLKQMKQEHYSKLVSGQTSAVVSESSGTVTSNKMALPEVGFTKTVEWTQPEQRAFEQALQKFPKGTDERWDRISESVGSKSKAQCMERFKLLAEAVKKKKAAIEAISKVSF